jgi:hypothetical protein
MKSFKRILINRDVYDIGVDSLGQLLYRMLLGKASEKTDSSLHDWFISVFPRWTSDPDELWFRVGRTRLIRPTEPSGRTMLAFVRLCATANSPSPFVRDFMLSQHTRNIRLFFKVLVDAAQTMFQDGQVEDAHWLLKVRPNDAT